MKRSDTFGGIPAAFSSYSNSQILLQPILYDGTSTWGKGSDKGFDRFLVASENMELYDIEMHFEVYRHGIHILPDLEFENSPESVYKACYSQTRDLLETNKFLTFFGGEHSISIGIIKAMYEYYDNLTVLQIDAHADLRAHYMGSPFNHACALYDASQNCNLIQVGIRSMCVEEEDILDRTKCFFAQEIINSKAWVREALGVMTDKVYITLDLDAFDPSVFPATGTPEPGGLDWYSALNFLREVFENKNVVGFDIVEFAPINGIHFPEFMVSKLYYKMLSYKFSK